MDVSTQQTSTANLAGKNFYGMSNLEMETSNLSSFSPAQALLNQKDALLKALPRLSRFREALDDARNLSAGQWAQWYAVTREFDPDIVLELGRGRGNSTVVVNEALTQLKRERGFKSRRPFSRVVSYCLSEDWRRYTLPRIQPILSELEDPKDSNPWLSSVFARECDITLEEFEPLLRPFKRILVIWDAHGFELAEVVLGKILPLIADRPHLVVMHDISDNRYSSGDLDYSGAPIFKGMDWVYEKEQFQSLLHLGWITTIVDQAIPTVDFLYRNGLQLKSCDHSFHQEILPFPDKLKTLEPLLERDDFDLVAHWAYFSLNEAKPPFRFPGVEIKAAPVKSSYELASSRKLLLKQLIRLTKERFKARWRGRASRAKGLIKAALR